MSNIPYAHDDFVEAGLIVHVLGLYYLTQGTAVPE
jgi:hypothetical protein